MTRNEDTKTPVGAQLAARILDVGPASADLGFGGLKSALQRGIGITLAALFLAPGTALADNECGPQLLPATAETVTCDPNDSYPDGITYSSDGALTLEVAPNDPVDLEVNEAGVDVTGNGADNIFWDSGGFDAGDITGTGIVLDYLSDTGNVDILIGGDIKGLDDATHAILAESTGGGNVSVTTLGDVNHRVGFSDPNPSGIGIEALTTSGDITIDAAGRVESWGSAAYAIHADSSAGGDIDISVAGDVTGRDDATHGILAGTNGTGALTITAAGGVDIGSTTGVAAIDATTGTGLLTVNITGSGFAENISGRSGNAIRTDAGGNAVINIGGGAVVNNGFASLSAGEAALDLNAAGETIINNDGSVGGSRRIAVRAAGGTLTVNNNGSIGGVLDFSGLDGGYTFNNNAGATWSAFLSADEGDIVGNLGAGDLNNAGTIELNRGNFVSAPGTTFTGIGDNSVLEMQGTLLDGKGQLDCRVPEAAAACLDLSGGTTAGQTAILIVTPSNNPRFFAEGVDKPVNPGIVLVDVRGGTSQADHFVLHPDSFANIDLDPGFGTDIIQVPLYAEDPVYGAVLKTGGLFDYALLYNPDTQQHILASVPQREGLEYVAFIDEALSIWHTTSDAVAGRQADLRSGSERGGWVRVVRERSERDAAPRMTTHGNTFVYDQGRTFDTTAVMAGADVASGDNYVIGLHAGVMSATQEFDDSTTSDRIKGATAGAYAGWWHDNGLTLDGTLNANFIPELDHRVRPGLETSANRNIKSYGVRAEAGWLMSMSESFYVQPLVTAAYVTANVDSLSLRDYELNFKDAKSARAALGVRLGGEKDLRGNRVSQVKYWLTARAWEEFSEDGRVEFATEGDPLAIEDDLSGSFEEVGLGVSLAVDDKLSVFLSGNGKFGDADSTNVTIGARLNW